MPALVGGVFAVALSSIFTNSLMVNATTNETFPQLFAIPQLVTFWSEVTFLPVCQHFWLFTADWPVQSTPYFPARCQWRPWRGSQWDCWWQWTSDTSNIGKFLCKGKIILPHWTKDCLFYQRTSMKIFILMVCELEVFFNNFKVRLVKFIHQRQTMGCPYFLHEQGTQWESNQGRWNGNPACDPPWMLL